MIKTKTIVCTDCYNYQTYHFSNDQMESVAKQYFRESGWTEAITGEPRCKECERKRKEAKSD